ncbi:MAG: 4Fe-4S binding protein [Anaerolineae bacterium]|jgi:MauM/NapG family ferredoxin protein
MRPRHWRRLRQATQVVALLVFLGIFVYTNAQRPQRFWADLFARLDPLLVLSASLAGRALVSGALLAGLVLLVSLLFGRVWCGWFCPLGTLLEWLAPRRRRLAGRRSPPEALRAAKYLLLLTALLLALLGFQPLIALDPITILNRTLTTAAWPALRSAVVGAEAALYRFPALWGALDVVHGAVVQPVFQEVQPVFGLGLLMVLVFVGLVALNWWAERFWCRYLCPLGGLLGLVSKLSVVRRTVADDCGDCARCTHECPTGTIDPRRGYRSDPAECIVCYDCLTDCTRQGIGFRWQWPAWRPAPWREYDPGRRQALLTAGAAVAGAGLLAVEPIARRDPPDLIRPPGARRVDFGALCIRCGACLRVCPSQGLQLSLGEGGLQNLFTPRLVPRLGACNFPCNACGQVCPTGALPPLVLEEKQAEVIGLARVDRDRCLPWAYDVACIVCEEACPVADKAIKLEEVTVVDGAGQEVLLQQPYVVAELCIGCGICEHQCPMGGEAAIRVFAPLPEEILSA